MTEELVEFASLGEANEVAVARLVREKPLNSLLLETINLLSGKFPAWLDDSTTRCLLLDSSSERAFCAGADITALYHSIREAEGGENAYAEAFFEHEYRLDHALHSATKPVVAWGNGIVMGGGLGLLGGCSHRIATPTTRMAMPEITIGLFPDAGGTWFLSRMPDGLGIFAGLTGCQLSAGDALDLGLADVVVEPSSKTEILDMLTHLPWSGDADANRAAISEGLTGFALNDDFPRNLLRFREPVSQLMQRCLSSDDFFATFEAGLEGLPGDEWLDTAVANYRSGSAVTARVFIEQLQRAEAMTLADMFRMELTIARQCIRHPDFPEGVRALLIDKDRNPAWSYPSPGAVPDEVVKAHFEPTWEGEHPLADLA